MTEWPKVSLIIPTFNRSELLKIAVASCQEQDYPNLEIVISDNCSTDDTCQMVRDNFSHDPRIRYFRNEMNILTAPNWRRAVFQYATGDYGELLCDDEYLINPQHISEAVALALKHNLKLVQCGVKYCNDMTGQEKDMFLPLPEVVSAQWLLRNCGREYRFSHIFFGLYGLFDLNLARSLDAFNYRIFGLDFELVWRLIIASGSMGYLPGFHRMLRDHDEMGCLIAPYPNALEGGKMFGRLYEMGRKFGYYPQTMARFKTAAVTHYGRYFLLALWLRDHGSSLRSLSAFLQEVAKLDQAASRRVFLHPVVLIKALVLHHQKLYRFLSDLYWLIRFKENRLTITNKSLA